MGAGWRRWQLTRLIVWLIWVVVRCFRGMGVADFRSLRFNNYIHMQHFVRRTTSFPFRRFWGDVRREFMQRLSAALHGTLGSYLRDALHEGSADAVACLPVPRATQHFVRLTNVVPFRRSWGNVRREYMQRLFASLHGTLGSYLCFIGGQC
jgi:hypothetical protein